MCPPAVDGAVSMLLAAGLVAGTAAAGLAIAGVPMIAVFLVFPRQILVAVSAGSING
jgi:hypothetical protein